MGGRQYDISQTTLIYITQILEANKTENVLHVLILHVRMQFLIFLLALKKIHRK